jgi:hypothetical protein
MDKEQSVGANTEEEAGDQEIGGEVCGSIGDAAAARQAARRPRFRDEQNRADDDHSCAGIDLGRGLPREGQDVSSGPWRLLPGFTAARRPE